MGWDRRGAAIFSVSLARSAPRGRGRATPTPTPPTPTPTPTPTSTPRASFAFSASLASAGCAATLRSSLLNIYGRGAPMAARTAAARRPGLWRLQGATIYFSSAPTTPSSHALRRHRPRAGCASPFTRVPASTAAARDADPGRCARPCRAPRASLSSRFALSAGAADGWAAGRAMADGRRARGGARCRADRPRATATAPTWRAPTCRWRRRTRRSCSSPSHATACAPRPSGPRRVRGVLDGPVWGCVAAEDGGDGGSPSLAVGAGVRRSPPRE